MAEHNMKLTIDQILDGKPDPNPDQWPLIDKINEACSTPLEALLPSQLLELLMQKMALEIIVPMVLDLLETEPLMDVTFYSGDLLTNCMSCVPMEYWENDLDSRFRLELILLDLDHAMNSINEARPLFEKFYGTQPANENKIKRT